MQKELKNKINDYWSENKKPIILLLAFLLFAYLFLFSAVKDMKSLPTCVYGCDYYYENGVALDVLNNPGATWQSSSHDWLGFVNSLPKYYSYFRMFFTKLFDYNYFESWKSVFPMSYFLLFFGLFAYYIFFCRIFKNKYLSVALSIFAISLSSLPYFKYSTIFVPLLPFYLICLDELFKTDNSSKKDLVFSVLTFLIIMFLANLHAMSFFIVYFIVFFGFFFLFLKTINPKIIIHKLKDQKTRNKAILIVSLVLFTLLINILFGWWHHTLFIGKDENAYKFDIHADLNDPKNYFSEIGNDLKTIFFDYSNFTNSLISTGMLLGFLLFIFPKKKDHDSRMPYLLWISVFFLFSVFNYIITVPLIHNQLSATHAISFMSVFFKAVFIGYLIDTISKLKQFSLKKEHVTAISIILLLFFSATAIIDLNAKTKDKFWQNGKNEIFPHYKSLTQWMEENNKNPSDMVLLSTNELSFALHGITGCKLLAGRQAHFFHFGDFQKPWMDAAIIFYGNDTQTKLSLLKQYQSLAQGKKLYLYWDYYWVNSEWQPTDGTSYPFDPFRFEYSEERENILKQNGLAYLTVENAIFEPSAQNSPYATKLKIMYLTLENDYNATHPWSPDLDPYLKEVWYYEYSGQKVARLFEINLR